MLVQKKKTNILEISVRQGVLFDSRDTEMTNELRKAGIPSKQPLSNIEKKRAKKRK